MERKLSYNSCCITDVPLLQHKTSWLRIVYKINCYIRPLMHLPICLHVTFQCHERLFARSFWLKFSLIPVSFLNLFFNCFFIELHIFLCSPPCLRPPLQLSPNILQPRYAVSSAILFNQLVLVWTLLLFHLCNLIHRTGIFNNSFLAETILSNWAEDFSSKFLNIHMDFWHIFCFC